MNSNLVDIGIDLVDIDELQQLLDATEGAFLEVGWTSSELAQSHRQASHLAVCWAAKEAVMKALGLGLGEIDPHDVEVDMDDPRRPEVHLSGPAAAARIDRGFASLAVAVAHDRRWAIATAVAMGPAR
jgi:holo-[acyl-carrier protein] synthase